MPSCSCSFSSFVQVLRLNILLLAPEPEADPEADPEAGLEAAGAGAGAGAEAFLAIPLPPPPPPPRSEAGFDDEKKSRSKARGVVPACSRIQVMSAGVVGVLRGAASDPPLVEEKKERDLDVPLCLILLLIGGVVGTGGGARGRWGDGERVTILDFILP